MIGGESRPLPAVPGDRLEKRVRLGEPEIRAFARSVDDLNPLHHDAAVARAAGFPALIASGTHVGSLLMAMTATMFSEPLADGTPRSSLGLGFDIAFNGDPHAFIAGKKAAEPVEVAPEPAASKARKLTTIPMFSHTED